MLKKEKMYVLKDKKLRVEIISLHYNIPVMGYGGKWEMIKLVTRNYWWLEVTKEVGKYMKKCDIYQ